MKARIWSIIAIVLIACGIGFCMVALIMKGFDFTKFSTEGDEVTNEHVVEEDFTKISIDTSTADVRFEVSADGKARVVCHETEKRIHEVKVENGTLKIKEKNEKKWFEYIGIFGGFKKIEVTVYLPEKKAENSNRKEKGANATRMELDELRINTSTGDVELKDLLVKGDMILDSSTGQHRLTNVLAGSATIDISTGDVIINNSEFFGRLKIDGSTSDIRITSGDAETVNIDTSTGDIICSFLSEKNIKADTSTGDIRVPEQNGAGGECKLNTSTGDIKVEYVK